MIPLRAVTEISTPMLVNASSGSALTTHERLTR